MRNEEGTYLYTADLFLFFCPMRKPSASSSACPCLKTYASMTSAMFPIRFQEGKKKTKEKISFLQELEFSLEGWGFLQGLENSLMKVLRKYEMQFNSLIVLTKIFSITL
jgi:hypothetical protein